MLGHYLRRFQDFFKAGIYTTEPEGCLLGMNGSFISTRSFLLTAFRMESQFRIGNLS